MTLLGCRVPHGKSGDTRLGARAHGHRLLANGVDVVCSVAPCHGSAVPAAAAVSSDLVFIPDAGFRMESASNAAAGVDASGTVYLYCQGSKHDPEPAVW